MENEEQINTGPNMTASDLNANLTIFIVVEPTGNIKYTSNQEIDLHGAIAILELTKAKMVATYHTQVAMEVRKEEAKKPKILRVT